MKQRLSIILNEGKRLTRDTIIDLEIRCQTSQADTILITIAIYKKCMYMVRSFVLTL